MQSFYNRCCSDCFSCFCIIAKQGHLYSAGSQFSRQKTTRIFCSENPVVGYFVLCELHHLMQWFPVIIEYKMYLHKSDLVCGNDFMFQGFNVLSFYKKFYHDFTSFHVFVFATYSIYPSRHWIFASGDSISTAWLSQFVFFFTAFQSAREPS